MAGDPVRVDPQDVHRRIAAGEPLVLVCAYDEEDKARAFRLEGALTLREVEARLDTIDPGSTIVLYCAEAEDADAVARAREWTGRGGFARVCVLAGGVDAWKAAGFPMAQPAHRAEVDHTPEPAPLGPKPRVPEGQEPLPPRHDARAGAGAGVGSGAGGRAGGGAAAGGQKGGGGVGGGGTGGGGVGQLRARDLMTRSPEVITSAMSIEEAARRMRDFGIGALPVCDDQRRFLGMITDRDITVRCVAAGMPPSQTLVADVMTSELVCADEDTGVEQLARLMQEKGVRRVPILRKASSSAPSPGDIVGIISLDDLATDLRVSDLVARTLAQTSARGD